MPLERDIDHLITRIYDVVTSPGQWQPVLNEVTETLGARASNIFYGDSQHPELHDSWFSEVLDGILENQEHVKIVEAERNLYAAVPEIITTPGMVTEAALILQYNRLGYPRMELDGLYRLLRETFGIHHRI